MPRQLPWLNKGGSQVKTKKAPKKQIVASNIDDDFFDGTILASSKGKTRQEESDDDLPDLPAEPSTPRTKKRKDALRNRREESSSPPPIADLERPQVEFMQKGESKFDLRDDEWMMVEDEFLETAKLFTRHLHIAEYEKLKETIEQKKKEVARPVVRGAKMSITGAFKEKAKAQEKKQIKAIRDVFASQDDEGEEDVVSRRTSFSNAELSFASTNRNRDTPTSSRWGDDSFAEKDTDSDDLDAPRTAKSVSTTRASMTSTFPKSTSTPISSRFNKPPVSTLPKSTPSTSNSRLSKPATSPLFVKPALPPPNAKARALKASRANPFDMLDDYIPRKTHVTPKPEAERSLFSSSPTKPSAATTSPTKSKVERPADPLDDWGSRGRSKEAAERLEKRKAEREKVEKDRERAKRQAVKPDEIPTFLF